MSNAVPKMSDLLEYLQAAMAGHSTLLAVPEIVQAKMQRNAQAKLTAGQSAEAEKILGELHYLNPYSSEHSFRLGECILQQGRPEEAVRHFSKALNAIEAPPDAKLVQRIYFARGQALALLGHSLGAQSDLASASQGPDEALSQAAQQLRNSFTQ